MGEDVGPSLALAGSGGKERQVRADPLSVPQSAALARGVGHGPFSPSRAAGVPHIAACWPSSASRSLAPTCLRLENRPPFGVCHNSEDEQPLPLMARAHFRRSNESRRNSVAKCFEVSEASAEPVGVRSEPCDILSEEQGGTNLRHDSMNVGPQISRIICTAPATGL